MDRDFEQLSWNATVEADCRRLVRLAMEEDLAGGQDWTTVALVPLERRGAADIVAREPGVAAGMPALIAAIDELEFELTAALQVEDGVAVVAGDALATLSGTVRDLLTIERTLLNVLGRLMGVATRTARFVQLAADSKARIYDTRKTTPGWRRLEKYAVRCGGGCNHRLGLFDAVLIKDNHLAQAAEAGAGALDPPTAVRRAREFMSGPEGARAGAPAEPIVEVEVDSLEQLASVLPAAPDMVLLDNMSLDQLRQAVAMRDRHAPGILLEASGGVREDTVREIAATGVDRISVGGLTHSAVALDVALDWRTD